MQLRSLLALLIQVSKITYPDILISQLAENHQKSTALILTFFIEWGLRLQFNNHFVKTGKISIDKAKVFARIYERRQESDYDDFMEFTLEQAQEFYPAIVDLITTVHSLIP